MTPTAEEFAATARAVCEKDIGYYVSLLAGIAAAEKKRCYCDRQSCERCREIDRMKSYLTDLRIKYANV